MARITIVIPHYAVFSSLLLHPSEVFVSAAFELTCFHDFFQLFLLNHF
jgi:hypothetical protein